MCGAAATARTLCLAHLEEPVLAQALNDLRAGSLTLDLRGVKLENDRWKRIRDALTPDGKRGPRLDTARLTQASFGHEADLSAATFGDGADLREATFGDGTDLSAATFGDGADLREATFGDKASLRFATFGDKADLGGATFGDRAALIGATFGGNANLTGARFGEGANLTGATFGDNTDVVAARFGDWAALRAATFGDKANLTGARFGNWAALTGATFGDRADLTGARFGDRADLWAVTFGDKANLTRTTFGDNANLVDAWFVGDLALRGVAFDGQQRMLGPLYAGGTVDFYDAQFRGETRLEIDAAGAVLSRVVFSDSVEVRVLRARIEASETTFASTATIAALDKARRPDPTSSWMGDRSYKGNSLQHAKVAGASIRSLRRTDVSMLTIAGVGIAEARFAGAQGLDRLRLIDTKFDEYKGRQRVADERLLDEPDREPTLDERRMGHPQSTAGEVADIYRSLRKSREDSADAPGGNDLYIGELLMRRRYLRERDPQTAATRARRVLLVLYAWFGGHGVRPTSPILALLALLGSGWEVAAHIGLNKGGTIDALIFVMRSMLLLPNSHNVTTTTAGDAIQVALRVLGPLLIGLIALGLRAQVKR
jgi:hypothetical protein